MALYKGTNKAENLYYGAQKMAEAYLGDRHLWHNVPVTPGLIDRTITSYVIPDSVTTIGQSAFANCENLKSITIPNSVTKIDHHAFDRCSSLESVTIPNSVTSIGIDAFRGCSSLTSIVIPDSVTVIKVYAFTDCTSLQTITFPKSITTLETGLFYRSPNLTDIYCGFAEGAVSGAPWGAPESCTIHYNA